MQLDSWIDVLPMLAAIAAVLYVPGALIVAATGQHRPLHIIALAVPVSMSIAGVGGVLASAMDVRWGWGFHLAATLLVFAVVTAARALWRYVRRNESRPPVVGRRTAANSANPVTTNHTNRKFLPSAVTRGWRGWLPAAARRTHTPGRGAGPGHPPGPGLGDGPANPSCPFPRPDYAELRHSVSR